jgi:predicted transcriptional regulator
LFETKQGANWLGFRVFPDRIRVRSENLRRARRRLRILQKDYATHKIDWEKVSTSITSWIAHLEHGDTYQLKKKIFDSLVFSRD